jgi:hypothetical protein
MKTKITTKHGLLVEVESSSTQEVAELIRELSSQRIRGTYKTKAPGNTFRTELKKGLHSVKGKRQSYNPWTSHDTRLVVNETLRARGQGKSFVVALDNSHREIKRVGDFKGRSKDSIGSRILEIRKFLGDNKSTITEDTRKAIDEYLMTSVPSDYLTPKEA